MEKIIKHKSVLLQEIIQFLDPKPGGVYIDATIGFGGHAEEILKKISSQGKLLGIDQDEEALGHIKSSLLPEYPNLTLKKANFTEIGKISKEMRLKSVEGIVADIGVSSYQLDRPDRGFSFKSDGPLDMRMDKSQELTAEKVINTYSENELVKIFSSYGEERLSKTIAREITAQRKKKLFESTLELAELIQVLYDKKGLKRAKIHPATRVFQSLRIEVNSELESLEKFLSQAIELLAPKGRLAVITFHSLEDRIVKDFYKKEAKGCICPSEYPLCKCGHVPQAKIITKKPVTPSDKEIRENPRARSAKLRVIEKI